MKYSGWGDFKLQPNTLTVRRTQKETDLCYKETDTHTRTSTRPGDTDQDMTWTRECTKYHQDQDQDRRITSSHHP